MISVMIRHVDGEDALLLGEFQPSELGHLIDFYKHQVTYINGTQCLYLDHQVVVTDKDIYLEIIVCEED